jgi:hypothetical protein
LIIAALQQFFLGLAIAQSLFVRSDRNDAFRIGPEIRSRRSARGTQTRFGRHLGIGGFGKESIQGNAKRAAATVESIKGASPDLNQLGNFL